MMEVLEEKEVDLDEGRETAALTAVAMFMNYEYSEEDDNEDQQEEESRTTIY